MRQAHAGAGASASSGAGGSQASAGAGASASGAGAGASAGAGATAGTGSQGASGANGAIPTESGGHTKVTTYNNAGDAAGKNQIYNALKQQGASDQRIATIEAMAEQETSHLNVNQHDGSKSGASANYSEFNLNPGELNHLGFNDPAERQKLGLSGNLNDLNKQENQGKVAQLINDGITREGHGNDELGTKRVQNETRGGSGATNQFNRHDLQEWRSGQDAAAREILNGHHLRDNTRTASQANYV